MSSKIFFTLDEANSLIPKLLDWVPAIQNLSVSMRRDFPDISNAHEKAKWNGGSNEGAAYLSVVMQYNDIIQQIESAGCEVKGINEGLVDFPSIRDGREVYLCWRMPEQEIRFWHDTHSGFAGRQPI
ncbi:MAG: DUF2203 domain-containing protein [Nitrospinaceae bacterium]